MDINKFKSIELKKGNKYKLLNLTDKTEQLNYSSKVIKGGVYSFSIKLTFKQLIKLLGLNTKPAIKYLGIKKNWLDDQYSWHDQLIKESFKVTGIFYAYQALSNEPGIINMGEYRFVMVNTYSERNLSDSEGNLINTKVMFNELEGFLPNNQYKGVAVFLM